MSAGDLSPTRWAAATSYWLTSYRRRWRGTIVSSVVEPTLFLAAMGLGLGSYVHGGHGAVDGVRYIAFLAPGLLAANGMQTAMSEGSWPVMGAVRWTRVYTAMRATPLTTSDIAIGHLAFMTIRIAMNATLFVVVMAAFDVLGTAGGIVPAWIAAILTGAAFAAVVSAFSVTAKRDQSLALLYRFGLIPLFLFSGTFFPIAQLPVGLRPIAWITPLWHGVSLCRNLTLGQGSAVVDLGHAAYLVGLIVLGLLLAVRAYRRRLTW
jgi:lipooligosaccharide transport system permease protein